MYHMCITYNIPTFYFYIHTHVMRVCYVTGGGVLSLPFALRRSGIFFGGILLVLTAVATDFTVFTLV